MTDDAEPVSYEDLAAIEDEFEAIDIEIMRKQYGMSQSAYAKRQEAISNIPNFWGLVLEQAPPDIDQYIQPQDSHLLGESLVNVEVTRPEIAVGPEKLNGASTGNPRSLRIKFEFKPNDYFEDTALEKSFWYRRASHGRTGLVSEPVKIHWKKGMDLTEGATNMAVALWEARKRTGDMANRGLPEYTALKKQLEQTNPTSTSFFAWFAWVSGSRWVSAEESDKANVEYQQRKEQRKLGKNSEMAERPEEEVEDEVEDEDDHDQAVEVHENGEELAISIAEDLWPGAIKYFTAAQELGDLSDADFEEGEDEEDAEEDDDGDVPIDIRSLVQDRSRPQAKPQHSAGPPSKKQKR